MKCPKCQSSPLPPREYFKLAHGAGPVMVQCRECYASLTWMNRRPLAAAAGLASFAVAVVLAVAGELVAEQVNIFVRVTVLTLGTVLTYAALSYRAWMHVVVRPSTLADLQSVPDAAAREMRTEETLFSYVYVAIIMLAIGLTLVGAGASKLYGSIQTETEIIDTVYFALAGGIIFLIIGILIFRFRKRMAEATLENLRRKEIAWKAIYSSMGPDMVIQKFQQRRKRLVPLALTPILLGIIVIALSLTIHGFAQTKWADEEVIAVIAGFVLFGCGIIFLGASFHCPVCSEPPWASVPGAGRGMTLDPISCPTCGSPLRREGLFHAPADEEKSDVIMLDESGAPILEKKSDTESTDSSKPDEKGAEPVAASTDAKAPEEMTSAKSVEDNATPKKIGTSVTSQPEKKISAPPIAPKAPDTKPADTAKNA